MISAHMGAEFSIRRSLTKTKINPKDTLPTRNGTDSGAFVTKGVNHHQSPIVAVKMVIIGIPITIVLFSTSSASVGSFDKYDLITEIRIIFIQTRE